MGIKQGEIEAGLYLLLVPKDQINPAGLMRKRRFTEKELRQYNGKNGMPAFIACGGWVYDVSNSFLWQKGRHQAMHNAGLDLTESIAQAPHGTEFLERFSVIGNLDKQ